MRLLFGVIGIAVLLLPGQAAAQDLFANPFLGSAETVAARGETQNATLRLVYAKTGDLRDPTARSEITIDLAPDWALYREGPRTALHDYRLNRRFELHGESFTSHNPLGLLAFRATERENRAMLGQVAAAAGAAEAAAAAGHPCDADAELGVAYPGSGDSAALRATEREISLRCDDRSFGSVVPGEGPAPPATLWPTLRREWVIHPMLFERMARAGAAPQAVETSFRALAGVAEMEWRLVSAEAVATPYPLTASMQNTTAQLIDAELPGLGAIAQDAVAGRASGGAPTLAQWDAHIASLIRDEGAAAAAMLLMPTFNAFPEVETACPSGALAICGVLRELRATALSDPAVLAAPEIGMAQQEGNSARALAAMQRAQTSPHANHPALGAAFALALLEFSPEQLAAARAANLPTDPAQLQAAAIAAFPYVPTYWTDIGDRLSHAYRWPEAFLFYDVAYALPMPSVVSNRALQNKRASFAQMHDYFSDFDLPN